MKNFDDFFILNQKQGNWFMQSIDFEWKAKKLVNAVIQFHLHLR